MIELYEKIQNYSSGMKSIKKFNKGKSNSIGASLTLVEGLYRFPLCGRLVKQWDEFRGSPYHQYYSKYQPELDKLRYSIDPVKPKVTHKVIPSIIRKSVGG